MQAVVEEQADHDEEQAEQSRLQKVGKVRDAGESPQAAVEANPPEHEALHSQNDGKLSEIQGWHGAISHHAVAQPVQPQPGDRHHEQVMDDHQHPGQCSAPSLAKIQLHRTAPSLSLARHLRSAHHPPAHAVYHANRQGSMKPGRACSSDIAIAPEAAATVTAKYPDVTGG